MLSKILLWVIAGAYFLYGAMCLYDPNIQANYAGFALNSGDAYLEIGAIYGGMSLGLGVFFLMGALQPALTRASLLLMALTLGGLGCSRLLLFAIGDASVTSYTYGAMGFELVAALLGLVAWRSQPPAATP